MASFGTRLKQEREQRGITLDTIALSTKIGARFLRALEEDHFDQLPGGIFNRGFVRAYARCVGLDEDETIASYLIASGEVQPKIAEPVEPSRPVAPAKDKGDEATDEGGQEKRVPWGRFALVLVVAVLGLAIWRFFSRDSAERTTAVGSASVSPSSAQVKTQPPASIAAPQNAPATPPATAEAASASPSTPSFVVLIRASEDSWVSVTDADGKPIFEDTLEASTEKSIAAHSEIKVKVGNLGGLDFWFNGAKLATQGDEGEVKTMTFDANGLRPPSAKPQAADVPPLSP